MKSDRCGWPTKPMWLGVVVALVLAGCSDDKRPAGTAGKEPAADLAAGKAIAEHECKTCHGLDGKGMAPGIPNLAGQRASYLISSLQEYKDGRRLHGALRNIAEHLSEADTRNIVGYYASLPPIMPVADATKLRFSPYEHGKVLAAPCMECHGADGNSKTAGTPNLAGQQPHYFVTATHEYLNGVRETTPMHGLIRGLNRVDLDSVALYFASQTPTPRPAPSFGDPSTGEAKTVLCAGCHGLHGVSSDSTTPSLASQDPDYLVRSTKAYRNKRQHAPMQLAVAALTDKDIENIAAYYTVQKSRPAEKGQEIVSKLTEQCNRCHSARADLAAANFPRINGQDKDYLTMSLRAYRDNRRRSSVMHNMSIPYGDAIIESLASFYASQPPNPSK